MVTAVPFLSCIVGQLAKYSLQYDFTQQGHGDLYINSTLKLSLAGKSKILIMGFTQSIRLKTENQLD